MRLSKDSDTRSVQIGLIGTVLIHVLLLWLAPKLESKFGSAVVVQSGANSSSSSFEIELAPDAFTAPELPSPQRFVEVNPDAPDNAPDKTQNFGAQNQQVAQEVPDPDGKSDAPAVEGQKEIESTAIVSGSRNPEPAEITQVQPPSPEVMQEIQQALQEAARQAQNPLPGTEKIDGDSAEGIGSNIVKLPENPQAVPERIEGTTDATQREGSATGGAFRVDPSRPAPRPTLNSSQVRPAFLAERVEGSSNLGVIAHNALRTEYGAYLARIIDAVDTQWDKNIRAKIQGGVSYPLANSKVTVKFSLNKDGDVAIVNVDSTTDTVWSRVCVDAVAQRAPYGVWSADMIAAMGDSTEITFTFHYQ
ncbi:hypothetical protein MASR2M8_01720 [Opitutaceae bacterium]